MTIPHRLRNQVFHAKWPTTFHGTKYHLVASILGHSHPGMPGDQLIDGTILEGANAAGRSDAGFYTSPTIRYAGLQMYAAAAEFQYGSKHWGQVVLQCKQAPLPQTADCLKKQETMGFLCPDGMYNGVFQKYWSKLGHPDDPETKAAPKNFATVRGSNSIPISVYGVIEVEGRSFSVKSIWCVCVSIRMV